MHNIKLTLAYDGSDFHGWQVQRGQPTIQVALTDVVRKLTGEKLTVHGAGRTDAGVHAAGQVAHFKTHSELTPAEFERAFNALLPPAIRVLAAEEVGPEFHARWQAQAKTYHYRIYRGRVVPPFEWRYVLHYPYPLDLPAMAAAAGSLRASTISPRLLLRAVPRTTTVCAPLPGSSIAPRSRSPTTATPSPTPSGAALFFATWCARSSGRCWKSAAASFRLPTFRVCLRCATARVPARPCRHRDCVWFQWSIPTPRRRSLEVWGRPDRARPSARKWASHLSSEFR